MVGWDIPHGVCFSLYTYIHTYIHTYVRTYTQTYIHTYIHTHIGNASRRVCIHTYVYTCIGNMHTYIRIYIYRKRVSARPPASHARPPNGTITGAPLRRNPTQSFCCRGFRLQNSMDAYNVKAARYVYVCACYIYICTCVCVCARARV